MVYVIKRTDGKYVSKSGSLKSYTTSFTHARKFASRERAEQDMCGNEYVEEIDALLI